MGERIFVISVSNFPFHGGDSNISFPIIYIYIYISPMNI